MFSREKYYRSYSEQRDESHASEHGSSSSDEDTSGSRPKRTSKRSSQRDEKVSKPDESDIEPSYNSRYGTDYGQSPKSDKEHAEDLHNKTKDDYPFSGSPYKRRGAISEGEGYKEFKYGRDFETKDASSSSQCDDDYQMSAEDYNALASFTYADSSSSGYDDGSESPRGTRY